MEFPVFIISISREVLPIFSFEIAFKTLFMTIIWTIGYMQISFKDIYVYTVASKIMEQFHYFKNKQLLRKILKQVDFYLYIIFSMFCCKSITYVHSLTSLPSSNVSTTIIRAYFTWELMSCIPQIRLKCENTYLAFFLRTDKNSILTKSNFRFILHLSVIWIFSKFVLGARSVRNGIWQHSILVGE